jgi:hypothetical protein
MSHLYIVNKNMCHGSGVIDPDPTLKGYIASLGQ